MTGHDKGQPPMNHAKQNTLVSASWLAEHLDDPNIAIVDASFFVPGGTAPAKKQFSERHIPGSVFFDINEIADCDSSQDHSMPSSAVFDSKIGLLGIGNESHVIAYDSMGGGCAAARVWWMFKAFGHDMVSVLNGGLVRWEMEGHPLTQLLPIRQEKSFTAKREALGRVMSKADMLANIDTQAYQVIDARSAGRFAGIDPEPRPGLRAGHIPGSINIPYTDLFDSDEKTLASETQLKEQFDCAGVDLTRPITTSCGSGVTACTIALAAYLLGKADVSIYDGSWVDWASDPDTPITTGPTR